MQQYILRRILLMIPVLWGVTMIVFFAVRILPGDVVLERMSEGAFHDEADLQKLRHDLGLDVPAHIQYVRWMGGVLTGNLGESFWTYRPVMRELARTVPVSAELAVLSMIVTVSFALPLGLISAIRQDTWLDYVLRIISIAGLSVPSFVIAVAVILFPALWWSYAPPSAYTPFDRDPLTNLELVLPAAIALGFHSSATGMRMARSSMLEVLREDYIRTAWAKGLRERVVIIRHALKNAMIPVITILGQQFGFLLGGSVIIEQIFGFPGVGKLIYDAIFHRDYPLIQGGVLFLAVVFVVVNLLVDISYAWFDPRIRYN